MEIGTFILGLIVGVSASWIFALLMAFHQMKKSQAFANSLLGAVNNSMMKINHVDPILKEDKDGTDTTKKI